MPLSERAGATTWTAKTLVETTRTSRCRSPLRTDRLKARVKVEKTVEAGGTGLDFPAKRDAGFDPNRLSRPVIPDGRTEPENSAGQPHDPRSCHPRSTTFDASAARTRTGGAPQNR
ncbi:hypothetical protein GCM10010435_69660 [Winogradskya consettensis]